MRRNVMRVLWTWIALAALSPCFIADRDTYRTELEEQSRSRLYVVPLRIESRDANKATACADVGIEQLQIKLRGRQLKRRSEAVQMNSTLDRRSRPMLHALVFDTSGSMSLDLIDARRAAHEYLGQLDPVVDSGMVVGFDDGVTLWRGVTESTVELGAAIDRLGVGGQTSLFDALVSTIRELDMHRERPVVILLSDGADNASFYDLRDVLEELNKRPDIAIFAIALGRRSSGTKQLLQELAKTTHGKYFEVERGEELSDVFRVIRETLGTEAMLTVADPDPALPPGEIEVHARGGCRVTVLGSWADVEERKAANEPIVISGDSLPRSFSSPISAAYEKILSSATFESDANRCFDRRVSAARQPRRWSFEVEAGKTLGCGPDITLEHGFLYNPTASLLIERNPQVLVKRRPFEFITPEPAALPRSSDAIVERLLEQLPPDPVGAEFDLLDRETHAQKLFGMPSVVSGATFLEMRPRVARALFMQPAYRDWAMRRLQKESDAHIERLRQRYRGRFPDASEAALKLAVDQSEEARAIRTRAVQPSEVDIQPFLAAWHGDLSAQQLFNRWERRKLQSLLTEEALEELPDFLERWNRLRHIFAAPSVTRVVAPLVPIYEQACDCIGFYRVVMPRPSLVRARLRERTPFQGAIPLDLPARFPFGYTVLRELVVNSPEWGAKLRSDDYRVVALHYELMGPAAGHDPRHAFRETRVRIDLARRERPSEAVQILAELHVTIPPPNLRHRIKPRWLLDELHIATEGDAELRRLGGALAKRMVGMELLKERFKQIEVGASR